MERLNASAMLQLVEDLISSKNASELLVKLQIGLKPIAMFSDMLILTQDQQQLCALATTYEPLSGVCLLQHDALIKRVFDNNVLVVNTHQLPQEWQLPQSAEKVVLVANNFAERRGIFILFLADKAIDSAPLENHLIASISVFRQAFIQLDHQHQASQMLLDRTYALTQSQQRFQAYAELASDWFWETDESMCFTYFSFTEQSRPSNFAHFLHKSPLNIRSDNESIQFKKWEHFLHLVRQHHDILDFEFEAIDNQGHTVWISISGKAKYNADKSFAGYLGIAKDISFAKQREADLKLAKEKAESANTAKSHFLAVMSHEIRTPMNAILGILELLEDTKPNEKQRELIDFMRGSAQLLQGVISDTLDFAKIESGKLVLHPSTINLHLLLKNLVKQFETQALKQGLDFNFEMAKRVPELVICDGLRLSQVLLNLLGNAFKFTHKGSVNLHVSRNDSQLIFRVKDTGVGIPPRKISSLFEPFTQLKGNTQARQQGVGLGLSITKRLLTLMQGNIDCHSEVGEFSEFIVSIPLEEVENVEAHNNSTGIDVDSSVSGYRILVAEDNVANQFVIQAILEKRNHQVTLVENGELAVQATDNQSFDLVLMDMMMPVMDGVEAARRIREKFTSTELPIIALTANAGITDRAKCFQSGMNEVITKPLDSQLLEQKIQQFGHR